MPRWLLAAVPFGVAALVVLLSGNLSQQTALMADGDLNAASIEMDHNAMLANDPSKNAAFLKAFSSYLPDGAPGASLQGAKGTTQLAQDQHGKHRSLSAGAESRLNAKLAKSMQAQLTAASQGDQLMTPHFVAALDAASHMEAKQTMLASAQDERREEHRQVMDAMAMTQKGASHSHILPAKLRQQYAFANTKNKLGGATIYTPQQAALADSPQSNMQSLSQGAQPSPTGGSTGLASTADNSFLAASQADQPQMSTKELIQQAALAQMNSMQSGHSVPAASLKQPAATQQQLATQPPQQNSMMMMQPPLQPPAQMQAMYQEPMQQQPMQQQQQQQQEYAPAPTQMAYQRPSQPAYYGYGYSRPAEPAMYAPAQTQMAYQQPSPAQPYPQYPQANQQPQQYAQYAAPQQAPQMASPGMEQLSQPQQPPPQQQLSMEQPQQQPQQQQLSSTSGGGAPPSWRAPDATLKAGGQVIGMSTTQKAKVKQQMMALRSQILSDFKHNTKMGDTALLLGPGGL